MKPCIDCFKAEHFIWGLLWCVIAAQDFSTERSLLLANYLRQSIDRLRHLIYSTQRKQSCQLIACWGYATYKHLPYALETIKSFRQIKAEIQIFMYNLT